VRSWLLDTNVISELKRPKPNEAVVAWLTGTPRSRLSTSTVCVAEIRHGIQRLGDGAKIEALTHWLDEVVRPMFEGRILEANEDVLTKWRSLAEDADRNRRPAPAADLLIAATASLAGMAVATRDVAPFADAGLPVLNPFTGERFNGAA
jgi:toxin FitB